MVLCEIYFNVEYSMKSNQITEKITMQRLIFCFNWKHSKSKITNTLNFVWVWRWTKDMRYSLMMISIVNEAFRHTSSSVQFSLCLSLSLVMKWIFQAELFFSSSSPPPSQPFVSASFLCDSIPSSFEVIICWLNYCWCLCRTLLCV